MPPKRTPNLFFQLQQKAKKNNDPSFEYNGKTYFRATMKKKPYLTYYTTNTRR